MFWHLGQGGSGTGPFSTRAYTIELPVLYTYFVQLIAELLEEPITSGNLTTSGEEAVFCISGALKQTLESANGACRAVSGTEDE